MCITVTGVLWLILQAVIPLTEMQRAQIDSATDFTARFDEGALYPLLKNALQWQGTDEAGAIIPDYAAICQSPQEHRGKLFLIEGLFAGRSLPVKLSRAGPWDDQLQQWVVVVDSEKDEVAVVYLVSPPPVPRAGVPVRMAARFYKVWADKDRHGQPTNYLTFVGRQAVVKGSRGATGPGWGGQPLIGALVLLAGGWYFLRRTMRAKLSPHQQRRRELKRSSQIDIDETDTAVTALSQDPAEALGMLEQLHKEESF